MESSLERAWACWVEDVQGALDAAKARFAGSESLKKMMAQIMSNWSTSWSSAAFVTWRQWVSHAVLDRQKEERFRKEQEEREDEIKWLDLERQKALERAAELAKNMSNSDKDTEAAQAEQLALIKQAETIAAEVATRMMESGIKKAKAILSRWGFSVISKCLKRWHFRCQDDALQVAVSSRQADSILQGDKAELNSAKKEHAAEIRSLNQTISDLEAEMEELQKRPVGDGSGGAGGGTNASGENELIARMKIFKLKFALLLLSQGQIASQLDHGLDIGREGHALREVLGVRLGVGEDPIEHPIRTAKAMTRDILSNMTWVKGELAMGFHLWRLLLTAKRLEADQKVRHLKRVKIQYQDLLDTGPRGSVQIWRRNANRALVEQRLQEASIARGIAYRAEYQKKKDTLMLKKKGLAGEMSAALSAGDSEAASNINLKMGFAQSELLMEACFLASNIMSAVSGKELPESFDTALQEWRYNMDRTSERQCLSELHIAQKEKAKEGKKYQESYAEVDFGDFARCQELMAQIEELMKHVSFLEKQLQNTPPQNAEASTAPPPSRQSKTPGGEKLRGSYVVEDRDKVVNSREASIQEKRQDGDHDGNRLWGVVKEAERSHPRPIPKRPIQRDAEASDQDRNQYQDQDQDYQGQDQDYEGQGSEAEFVEGSPTYVTIIDDHRFLQDLLKLHSSNPNLNPNLTFLQDLLKLHSFVLRAQHEVDNAASRTITKPPQHTGHMEALRSVGASSPQGNPDPITQPTIVK